MSELRWTSAGAGSQTYRLTGAITEETDFRPLLEVLPSEATLVLEGITRINSCGVREWIYFVQDVEKAGKRLTLERCAVPFVHQMNMIANFVGECRVRSVMAPFLCTRCGADDAVVVDVANPPASQVKAPRSCPKCGASTEFDDIEASYFAFLSP